MNYSTIISRKAQDHFNGIKAEHFDLVTNMQAQKDRVDMFNEQKAQEAMMQRQQDQQMGLEQQKLGQQKEIETQKMSQESQFRQQDYDMKLMDALKT